MFLLFFVLGLIQLSAATPCTSACELEFANGCFPFQRNRGLSPEDAVAECEAEINAGSGPLGQVCKQDCTVSQATIDKLINGGNNTHPTVPTLCDTANQGRCDCANLKSSRDPWSVANTYTWYIDGTQRCVTSYVPPNVATPAATLLYLNCYGKDNLAGFNRPDSFAAAERFNMAFVFLSSPEGSWSWKDAVSNEDTPMPCSQKQAGEDYSYVTDVLQNLLEFHPDTYDLKRVYTHGFSQNGMGSAFIGRCFPSHITGSWIGGAGLFAHNIPGNPGGPIPPGGEGTCEDCMFWPVYPCYGRATEHTVQACIQGYVNDGVTMDQGDPSKGHEPFLFSKLVAEGNDGRIMLFQPDAAQGISGGHSLPANPWDWAVGCWGGVTPFCSSRCESALEGCMEAEGGTHPTAYATCVTATLVRSGQCEEGCTPTEHMLLQSETPYRMETTTDTTFGYPVHVSTTQPSTSICVNSN